MKLLFFFTACVVLAAGKNLLNFFPSCVIEGDVETCILKVLESVRPRLKYGLPEIGLPPLDPFMLEELDIDTSLPHLKIKCTATNIIAYGVSDFRIQNFKIDSRTYGFEITAVLPYLTITADYETDGSKIFFVHLDGRGKFKGTFNGVVAVIRGLMRPKIKDGLEYLSIESLTTQISFGNSELNVSPQRSTFTARAAAAYINARPEAIMDLLTPVIDDYTAPILKMHINKLIEGISMDRLLIYK